MGLPRLKVSLTPGLQPELLTSDEEERPVALLYWPPVENPPRDATEEVHLLARALAAAPEALELLRECELFLRVIGLTSSPAHELGAKARALLQSVKEG